ncbi:hypothetical protein [Serratia sp. DD3]|uniref:hypothetical protein n=1 Tax=Serratia sp. DD3 TaxID=1410619 RepID=UPI0004D54C72|nr:hypothetical protein [Serratia sp. DD3]KEY58583.1 hypothetical protein SRDD_28310 [Serratia sp. DD3]
MKKITNVFLQHSCSYTREGIKSILAELNSISSINVVAEQKQLSHDLSWLKPEQDIDVFILELQSTGNNASERLSFIMNILPSLSPKVKVVIMTQLNNQGTLKDSLLQFNNVYAVLEQPRTLQQMRQCLTKILTLPNNVQPDTVQSSPIVM